jgi:hypothetical protein
MTGCRSDWAVKVWSGLQMATSAAPHQQQQHDWKRSARENVGAPRPCAWDRSMWSDQKTMARKQSGRHKLHMNLQAHTKKLTKVEQHRLAKSRLFSLERHRGMQAVAVGPRKIDHACMHVMGPARRVFAHGRGRSDALTVSREPRY